MTKNIVICCDGTGNEYGKNKTNVILTSEISINDDKQLIYYGSGVGTGGFDYGIIETLKDQATGGGLQKNIDEAYRYLMQTYQAGDNIFLFGFSRGAFTVRLLAGMLNHCGLLYENKHNLIEYASKIYNNDDDLDAGFKKDHCRPCPIHFIGVWDTVESLIGDANDRSHDSRLNKEIKHAYHAVSIDEKRKDFPPSLWDERNKSAEQIIEQVWFAGVHSDVGGWYPERGLSDIALEWMLRHAEHHGLKLDEEKMTQLKPNPKGKIHKSYTGFFKIRGTHERQIPKGSKIHDSVKCRMDKTGYFPVKEFPPKEDFSWAKTRKK